MIKYMQFFIILCLLILLNGCMIHKQNSSYLLRTSGLCEAGLPVEKGDVILDLTFQKVKVIDRIQVTEYNYSVDGENEIEVVGNENIDIDKINPMKNINLRLGLTDKDELSLGLQRGAINDEIKVTSSNASDASTSEIDNSTKYQGFKVGYKRLLQEFENNLYLSGYVSLLGMKFSSEDLAKVYDAKTFEIKTAVLFSSLYQKEHRKSYPSLAFYHVYMHSARKQSVPDLPLKRDLHYLGAELSMRVQLAFIYGLVSTSIEKNISSNSGSLDSDLKPQINFSLGIDFVN